MTFLRNRSFTSRRTSLRQAVPLDFGEGVRGISARERQLLEEARELISRIQHLLGTVVDFIDHALTDKRSVDATQYASVISIADALHDRRLIYILNSFKRGGRRYDLLERPH